MFEHILDYEGVSGAEPQVLVTARLLKSTQNGEDGSWRFAGIASDESTDVQGDAILKKSFDLSYAQERGYVNWDHSRQPEDQIGFLTKCQIVGPRQVGELRKSFPDLEISDTASIYVEGELYKHVPKAAHVQNLLKSTPDDHAGPGLSLDGSLARDKKNGGIVKAYVRGVAITTQPVQPKTLLKLRKSLEAMAEIEGMGGLPTDLPQAIASQVVELLQKSTAGTRGFDYDQAVLFVLKQRPRWSYEMATAAVEHTIKRTQRS
jgi:hypothetical protein